MPGTPPGSKLFHFHAVLGEKCAEHTHVGSWLASSPQENPGSATVIFKHRNQTVVYAVQMSMKISKEFHIIRLATETYNSD